MNFKKIYLESTSKFQEGLFSFGIDGAAKAVFNIIYNFSWPYLVRSKDWGICYSNANGDLVPLYTWIRSPDYNLVRYLKVIDKAFRKDTNTNIGEVVSFKQYKRIMNSLKLFLNKNIEYSNFNIRIDVVLVKGLFSIEHLKNVWTE